VIRLKRAYDPPAKDEGTRILVDRLWPRGMTKEKAAIDVWMKDVAPSPELRKWYSHEDSKWDEFRKRYREELDGNGEWVGKLRDMAVKGEISLIYSTKDPDRNSATVLREYLLQAIENAKK
jgi:uncharacterized protein YeaO (DUF488 family)